VLLDALHSAQLDGVFTDNPGPTVQWRYYKERGEKPPIF
jgi:hypothetical protein